MPLFVRTLLQAIIGIAAIALIWAIASPIAIAQGVSAFLVPSPMQVIPKAIELYGSSAFHQHLWASLVAFGQGIVPALLAGLLVGLALRFSNVLRWVLGPLVVTIAAAPVVALAPLLIMWFGLSPAAKIALIVLTTAFPVANTVMTAPPQRLPHGDDAPWSRTRGALRATFAALRLGIMLGIIALIASELVGSKSGIGTFMSAALAQLDPTTMLAAFIVIAVPAILLIALLQAIEEQIAG